MYSVETTQPPAQQVSIRWVRQALFWGAALLVVALDQLTKGLVRGLLNRGESWPSSDWIVYIRYVTNTGAAFGILQNQTFFLIIMAVIGLAAIYVYYRYPPFDHLVVPIAIGMLLGGALGNLMDRVRVGEVTDFIKFPMWPAFNVADSSISIGAVVLLVGYLIAGPGMTPDSHEDAPTDG